MRHWMVLAALIASPVAAQDLQPALDPVMIGQGLTLSATMRAQANRDARRLGYRDVDAYNRARGSRARASQARNCRAVARSPRPTGAYGPKYDRVRVLCRRAGFWPR